jgi:hypothetical protein
VIYALVGPHVPEDDRRRIEEAIAHWDASVLDEYARSGLVRHALDGARREPYFCIWCNGSVSWSRSNNPGSAARPWHFDHRSNPDGACQGQNSPPNQGCYIQLGHEDEEQFTRRMCKCIAEDGRSYCHHAVDPGVEGGRCLGGR